MKNLLLAFIAILLSISVFGQRGKDGDAVISGNPEYVNAYTYLTANCTVGDTIITVNNSNLNSNFSSNLAQGDLILIIQVQGVSITDMPHPGQTPSWGEITDYLNCGNYEFKEVVNVPNTNTIVVDCPISYNFSTNGKTMIVRVPRYNTLTINAGGVLSVPQWDGTQGGLLVVEVLGNTTIANGGIVDVSGLGFRGGQAYNPTTAISGGDRYADANRIEGTEKGEGIVGDVTYLAANTSGPFCRAAAGNAGGGGNAHNAGGGGGGNGGDPLLWVNGLGNPDASTANYAQAWDMENTITGLNSSTTSSGGGRGGYSFLNEDEDELNLPPGHTGWGPSKREAVGGLGGRPLDYSGGRIFMAGAGGAGEGNDNDAGDGGNGAGLVFFKTYGDISGSGQIIANGANGGSSIGTSAGWGQVDGKDGCGGGGAGGTIILETAANITFTGQIIANGGNGGDQELLAGAFANIDQAEGPGGGGSGGYITITNGAPTMTVNGGSNGITNSPYVDQFPQNGATSGGNGSTTVGSVSNYDISANGATICENTSTNLTATISGSLPNGTTLGWYDAEYGGNLVDTGLTFTTPTLSSTTTYYIKSCPGSFTVAVTVTVTPCGAPPVASFESSDSTICINDCINFTDISTGAPDNWNWYFFGADTPNSSQQNPTNICYSSAGTFDVALVSSNFSGSDSLFIADFITVNSLPNIAATPDTAICDGDTVNLYASGGNNYVWNNGLGNGATQNDTPTSNTTYTVVVTDNNQCTDSTTVDVTVNSLPTITLTPDTAICLGDTVNLYASGGNTYSWNNGLGNGATQDDSPTTNITYVVYVTDNNLCMDSASVDVSINSLPSVIANASNTNICSGDSVTLFGSGADSYVWDNGVTNNVSFIPGSTATYTVTGTDNNQCNNTDQITVNVSACGAPPVADFSILDSSICRNECIEFTDLTTGAPTSWTWYFYGTDTITSNVQNPNNICYNDTGSFDVALVVENANGSDSLFIPNLIMVNGLPPVIANASNTTLCQGDTLTLSGSGASSYSWNNGVVDDQEFVPVGTGSTIYTVIGTDTNNCSNSDQITVTINDCSIEPSAMFNASDTNLCIGDCIDFFDLSTGDPDSWTWYFNGANVASSTQQNPSNICFNSAGSFDVLLVVSNQTGIDSLLLSDYITVNNLPAITISPDTNICLGDSVNISASGGNTYNWDNGLGSGQSHTVSPTVNTFYTVTVTDNNNCNNTGAVLIGINQLPIITANASSLNICDGDTVTLFGSGGNSYSWDNGVLDNQPFVPSTTQTYEVTGIDINQCENTDQITVVIDNCLSPTIQFSANDSAICINDCIDFTDLSTENPTAWTWYFFGSETPVSTVQNPTDICYNSIGSFDVALVAENSFGSDSLFIPDFITVDSCSVPTTTVTVLIPNVFSPNNDGQNDLFMVTGTNLVSIDAQIYNRWGEMVYSFNQLNEGWDGRNNSGKEASDGTYFYLINLTTIEGEKLYKGTLTLVR